MPDPFGARSSASPASRFIVAAALAVCSFLYLMLCMKRDVGPYDEGLMLFDTIRVMDGDVLHRDFYVNYGPAQFYILAALFKLFGASVLVERIYHVVACCGCVAFVFIIVDRVASRLAAVAVASLTLAWMNVCAMPWLIMSMVTAAVLVCVAVVMPALAGGRAPIRLFATGICAGLVLSCRYDVGVATFGAFGATLLIVGWMSVGTCSGRLREAAAMLVPFGVGFMVVAVPLAIAFFRAGVIADLVFDIVTFPRQYYAKTRSLPFPTVTELLTAPGPLVDYIPALAIAIAVPAVIVAFGRGRRQSPSPFAGTLLLLVCLTSVGYAKAWVRISPPQVLMALVIASAMGGVLTRLITRRMRLLLVPFYLAVAVTLTLATVRTLPIAAANVAWASTSTAWSMPADGVPPPSGSCRSGAGFARMACFELSQDEIDAICYIQAHTNTDDPIYVGLAHHDKIFVNNILLYFAAGRRSVTKWHHFDPMLQNTISIQQAMIAELRRTPPKLIVLDASWDNANEPNDSRLSTGVTLLDDYIRQTYEPVKQFGVLTILEPRAKLPS